MWVQLVTVAAAVALVHGHGRILDPPGRGGLWRAGYSTTADYDDDGLNCGGFYHHHSVNGGKCGICGDPYDAATPRAHERGGVFDSGIITTSYDAGSIATIIVQISAYHMGYWEFKICPDLNNNEQECFDANLMELADGGTQYYPSGSGSYAVDYRIPSDISCEHCVLQWKYTAGNNWGDCRNGTQGLGCGDQEQFFGCSDIAITGGSPLINPESLLLSRLNDLGLVHLLFNSHSAPGFWSPKNTRTAQKAHNKRRKHKGKKKVKPYKSKWNSYWGYN